jgi:hypothetical protein
LLPSSWEMPSASAVLPVAGGPAKSSARPAIFFWRIMPNTSPHASRAAACPTNPEAIGIAVPLACKRPKPEQ